MEQRKFWLTLLIVGLLFHGLASLALPLGYDTYLHASYVADGLDDGEADIEWGAVRSGTESSEPTSVSADGKWAVWHTLMAIVFTMFGISSTSLHLFGFVLSMVCLLGIYVLSKHVFNEDVALKITALSSIYPPFIRATGRAYQEVWIAFLVCVFFTFAVLAFRQLNAQRKWALYGGSFAIVPLLLLTKGMPWQWSLAVLPVYLLFEHEQARRRVQPYAPLLAYLMTVLILSQNGLGVTDFELFDWIFVLLFCGLYAWLMFVFLGMFVFSLKNGELESTPESTMLTFSWISMGWILCGWIAALWLVEANNSGHSLMQTFVDFRHNPRYLSLLIIPILWSFASRGQLPEFKTTSAFSFFILACLLSFNAFMIFGAEPQREMEVFGEYIEDSTTEDTTILFLHDGAFAMHEMYVLQFSIDPESDDAHVAYWRTTGSGWQTELGDCSALGPTEWVIVSEHDDLYDVLNWTKVEFASDVGWGLYERPTSC